MAGPFDAAQQQRFDDELGRVLERYPPDQKQAAMIPALRLCQELLGHLTPEAMAYVAQRLGVSNLRAEEVATFYSMFHLSPHGQHVIDVCTNVSCSLRGADGVLGHLERKLGIRPGQTTSDKRFTLREVECLASCGTAPCMQIDERFVEELTPSKIDEALAKLA